jgi:hypothetical protein
MHLGHDHDHHRHGAAVIRELAPGVGHNAPPASRAAQWQTPHRPADAPPSEDRSEAEADVDLVERAFADSFLVATDTISFLRLARIPFAAIAADGARLVLLRVELEAVADVGGIAPQLGGGEFRYDPLPAMAVSQRRRLRFAYFDGTTVRALPFDEVRRLPPADA